MTTSTTTVRAVLADCNPFETLTVRRTWSGQLAAAPRFPDRAGASAASGSTCCPPSGSRRRQKRERQFRAWLACGC